jgi:anaerobic selenocysteine-containing dehydrogenase
MAEVSDGVWIGQEPGWDSPFNLGSHCAKGASVREHTHGERRLKYPMKKVGGEWVRISWEDAINEIGDQMMAIREESGPDSVYWLGSAKHSNEQSYLFQKFARYWGTNNVDHQARICHSTTVAGVANTWGYGAMTNSYNDIHNSKAIFIIGGNPAEAHPVSLLHVLRAKEQNNAPLIVCDPRFTRTAAHADEYVRFRPGADVALVWGILWHIFENGWEDREFIRTRVWGMDQIREEVARWHRDLVYGRHPAHHGEQQHPRLLHPSACAGEHGRVRRRHQHLPRPRQRAGGHGPRRPVSHAGGLLRPGQGLVGALGPRLGRGLGLAERSVRQDARRRRQGKGPDVRDRDSGVALDRRCA